MATSKILPLLFILFLFACNNNHEKFKSNPEYDGKAFKEELINKVHSYFKSKAISDLTNEFENNLNSIVDSSYLFSNYPNTETLFLFASETPKDYIASIDDFKNFPVYILEGMNLLVLKSTQGFIGYIYIKHETLSCNSMNGTKFEKDRLPNFVIIKKPAGKMSLYELVMKK